MTELYCRNATYFIEQRFRELWGNDDDFKYQIGVQVLEERHSRLEPKSTYEGPKESSDAAAAK